MIVDRGSRAKDPSLHHEAMRLTEHYSEHTRPHRTMITKQQSQHLKEIPEIRNNIANFTGVNTRLKTHGVCSSLTGGLSNPFWTSGGITWFTATAARFRTA